MHHTVVRKGIARYRIGVALILLAVALVAVACGPAGGGQPGAGPPRGSRVRVSVTAWRITVGEVPSGAVTFVVKNDGAVEHNVVILETQANLGGVQPGRTKELRVSLLPGTYTFICDSVGHREAGMVTTVIVK